MSLSTLHCAFAWMKHCHQIKFLSDYFNRQEILYQYYAYAFHGSAVSTVQVFNTLQDVTMR